MRIWNRILIALILLLFPTFIFSQEGLIQEFNSFFNSFHSIDNSISFSDNILTIRGTHENWTIIYFDSIELPENFTLKYQLRINSRDSAIVAETMLNMNLMNNTYNRVYPYIFYGLNNFGYHIGKGVWGNETGGPTLIENYDNIPINLNEWVYIIINYYDNVLAFYVDNRLVLSYEDINNDLNKRGYLGFLTNSDISIKNIELLNGQ